MLATHRIQLLIARLTEAYPQLRTILENASWLTFDRFLRMGAGVFVGALVARYLGPSDFGRINFAIATVALAAVPAALGIDSIVKRELVRRPHERAKILGTAFWLKFGAGTLIYGICALLVSFTGLDSQSRFLIHVLGITLLAQALGVPDLWFQATLKSRLSVYSATTAFILASGLRIFSVYQSATVRSFAVIIVLEVLLGSISIGIFYYRSCRDFRLWRLDWSEAKEIVRQGLPLLLSGIAVIIYMRIDQLMLQSMIGESAVGIYSAALRLTEVWYFIPGVLATSLFPSILRSKDVSPEFFQKRAQHYFDLSAALGYLIAIPASFLSPWVIQLFYGRTFAGAEAILTVQIWATIFVFLGVAREQVFLAEGWLKLSFATTVVGGVANILLNLIFIPRWSGLGAAAATVISQAIAVWIAPFFYHRSRATGISLGRSLALPVRLLLYGTRYF